MSTWGAIFDFDGVIIDSAAYHKESWEQLGELEGKKLPSDHFRRSFGRKNSYIIPELFQWTDDAAEVKRMSDRKEELYRDIVKKKGIEPLPGVWEWLQALQEAQVPMIIASSTDAENLRCILAITQLDKVFSSFVSSEDVTNGKPEPEVFLKAAEQLSLLPEQCVVFEDSLFGIEAGHRAGMRVVGVATTHPPEELLTVNAVVTRLDALTIEQLAGWFETCNAEN